MYRGFDIGTDKLPAHVLSAWPHVAIDVVEGDQPFTLYDWLKLARDAVATTHDGPRADLAIVVGGTGLYHRGLLRGYLVGGARPHDPELRTRLEREFAEEGRGHIEAQLRGLDPAAARSVEAASPRRLVRALEIAQLGGNPLATEEEPWPGPNAYVLLDDEDRLAHRTRIDARVATQFAQGLVAEAESLAARLPADTPALSGIGYREALRHLAGEISLQKAIGYASSRNWAYARRQRTWFRGEPISTMIRAGLSRTPDEIASDLHSIAFDLIEDRTR